MSGWTGQLRPRCCLRCANSSRTSPTLCPGVSTPAFARGRRAETTVVAGVDHLCAGLAERLSPSRVEVIGSDLCAARGEGADEGPALPSGSSARSPGWIGRCLDELLRHRSGRQVGVARSPRCPSAGRARGASSPWRYHEVLPWARRLSMSFALRRRRQGARPRSGRSVEPTVSLQRLQPCRRLQKPINVGCGCGRGVAPRFGLRRRAGGCSAPPPAAPRSTAALPTRGPAAGRRSPTTRPSRRASRGSG